MRAAVVCFFLAAFFAVVAVACYHNGPDPYFPNDPTCVPGGPLCPQARADAGARG